MATPSSFLMFRSGILPTLKKVLLQESSGAWLEFVTTLISPITLFLAFGVGLRGFMGQVEGIPFSQFIFPGLIAETILLQSFSIGAWSLWLDRWHQGMLDEARIKPVHAWDIILGQLLGGFVVALIKGILVGMVLWCLSPMPLIWQNIPLYLCFLLPGSLIFNCLGTMIGVSFKKPDTIAQSMTIIVTPLLYLGGMFFPINTLPAWLQPIVRLSPTAPVFEGGRHALLSGHVDMGYLLWLWGLAGISLVVAVIYFQWKVSE